MRGAKRTLIPIVYSDLTKWRAPDVNVLDEVQRSTYSKRRRAVEMYAAGIPYAEIKRDTGICRDETRRHVKRCLRLARDGDISGFWSLLPHIRLAGYTRTAEVKHQIGAGSGGCAGALQQLFERHPQIQQLIDGLVLKDKQTH